MDEIRWLLEGLAFHASNNDPGAALEWFVTWLSLLLGSIGR